MKINEKRIYESIEVTDGYRILADKLWPRGMKKEDAHFDLWAKNISPSKELRKSYHSKNLNFDEFSKKYLKELKENPGITDFLREIKKHKIITLLTSVKEIDESELPILKQFIDENI